MGCGDAESFAGIGAGSDIPGRIEEEGGPEVEEEVIVGCLPGFAGPVSSLAVEERLDEADEWSSEWFTF